MGDGVGQGQRAARRAEIVVLVVDDEPDLRHLTRIVLELSGHPVRVVEAADGPAALAAAEHEQIDMAVIDQMMPGQDGLSVASALVARHPDLSVALCSAAMDAGMAAQAEPLGVRWFLPKHELVRLPELLDELIAT